MQTRAGIARTAGALALAALAAAALAQAPGVKRSLLQRADVTGAEEKECVVGTAEIGPGGSTGRHIHHGFELGYVAEGEGEFLVDGEAPRKIKAGDSYRVEARRPHEARNVGTGAFKVVATWVVEKGKPLAEPVK
jgi:quercetin dioxygenase-like cupin family protein